MAKDREPAAAHPSSRIAVPSRLAAISACRDALDRGPVLLTGAAGVGKTTLLEGLTSSGRISWISVDAGPGMTIHEFSLSILMALGETAPSGPLRMALGRALAERSGDGRRFGLIVDEAHGASDEILEEVRLLTNRLGKPDGVAALILCGQTPLARRLESRALEGLESRLAARVHLLPLDEREARLWAECRRDGRTLSDDEVEDLVRESGGIPARIDRILQRLAPPRPAAKEPASLAAEPFRRETVASRVEAPPILPAKPPLLVEDGMIEVGWDSDVDLEPGIDDDDPADSIVTVEGAEEPVDDHYAALQAWDEWVKNQGRSPSPPSTVKASEAAMEDEEETLDEEPEASALDALPGTWADGKHGFGPYSQLFARARAVKGSE